MRADTTERFAADIRRRLDITGRSAAAVASASDLPQRSIYNVLDLRRPSLDRADEICRALGITLLLGAGHDRPRSVNAPPHSQIGAASEDSRLAALVEHLVAVWRDLSPAEREQFATSLGTIFDLVRGQGLRTAGRPGAGGAASVRTDGPHLAPTHSMEDGDPPGGRPVPMHELGVAAGGGAVDIDEAPLRGYAWFRREWLSRRGLDPTRCVVIDVRGGSMEPTLADGGSILVARDRTRRREGRVYVVLTEDGLVAKRAGREDGEWQLVSDSGPPDWPPVPWRHDDEVKGEVIWTARTLAPAPG